MSFSEYQSEVAGQTLRFRLEDGVKKRDYYEESMIVHIPTVLTNRLNRSLRLLNVGAGHGLSAVVLASLSPDIHVVATDLSAQAGRLVRENVARNGVAQQVEVRQHREVFDSVLPSERFDGIVAALPPVPLTLERLFELDAVTRAHHYPSEWGVGGPSGRRLIDILIASGVSRLRPSGFLLHVHADFVGTDETLRQMREHYRRVSLLGEVSVALDRTRLTLAQKGTIEALGYVFARDAGGGEYFKVQTFLAEAGGAQ